MQSTFKAAVVVLALSPAVAVPALASAPMSHGEKAVRALAAQPRQPDIQGSWIERWKASKPRELRYED